MTNFDYMSELKEDILTGVGGVGGGSITEVILNVFGFSHFYFILT